ncbi:MAG: hypothetical protein LBD71_07000 [Treponema sp.]|jgi:hypothetical protein|nr:hypothetical protein [Treponema sp.]
MGHIKSALEIAMERTESIRGDKTSINLYEAKQKGKKLANEFLEDPQKDFEAELKKASQEEQASIKQGAFDVFLSQLTLPLSKDDEKRIETIGRGLQVIIGGGRFTAVFKQLREALSRYLNEAARYEEAILRQYEPKLRAKEEELSRRMGRQVKMDPFQDPEFAAFYNQNMNALKGNYRTMIDEVSAEARRIFKAE